MLKIKIIKVMNMAKFDWKKSAMKLVSVGLPVLIAGIVSIYGDSVWWLAIAPVVAALSNVLKHKYKIDLKII